MPADTCPKGDAPVINRFGQPLGQAPQVLFKNEGLAGALPGSALRAKTELGGARLGGSFVGGGGGLVGQCGGVELRKVGPLGGQPAHVQALRAMAQDPIAALSGE